MYLKIFRLKIIMIHSSLCDRSDIFCDVWILFYWLASTPSSPLSLLMTINTGWDSKIPSLLLTIFWFAVHGRFTLHFIILSTQVHVNDFNVDSTVRFNIDSAKFSGLRILASYEAKIAKNCNFWTSRPVIKLINHLFKIWQIGFLPSDFEKMLY